MGGDGDTIAPSQEALPNAYYGGVPSQITQVVRDWVRFMAYRVTPSSGETV